MAILLLPKVSAIACHPERSGDQALTGGLRKPAWLFHLAEEQVAFGDVPQNLEHVMQSPEVWGRRWPCPAVQTRRVETSFRELRAKLAEILCVILEGESSKT